MTRLLVVIGLMLCGEVSVEVTISLGLALKCTLAREHVSNQQADSEGQGRLKCPTGVV
ncbi:hypothetical protein [Orrella marina]|uniref:hypothetical protein n=1 Tax=Orrella marina TaxID=2163011 RepID=UPI00131EE6EA|nr:hypothetical protein [Orrella marina]